MVYSDKRCPDCESDSIIKLVDKQNDEDTFNCKDCNTIWSTSYRYCKACLDVVIYCSCHN